MEDHKNKERRFIPIEFNEELILVKQKSCKYGDHELEDVVFVADVNFAGNVKKCHYQGMICKVCSLYYILEDTFIGYSRLGIYRCRPDGKAYKENSFNYDNKHKKTISIRPYHHVFLTENDLCLKDGHDLKDVTFSVGIYNNGITKQYEIPGIVCGTCEKYYIFKSIYDTYKVYGRIECLIEAQELPDMGFKDLKEPLDTSTFNSSSILSDKGYTVRADTNIKTFDRQKILAAIVEEKLMTRHQIASHLEHQISLRNKDPKYHNAIQKWREDIDFILHYGNGDLEVLSPDKIRKVIYLPKHKK